MMKLLTPKASERKEFELTIDEIAREGARRMLMHCLNLEVEEYINQNTNAVGEDVLDHFVVSLSAKAGGNASVI